MPQGQGAGTTLLLCRRPGEAQVQSLEVAVTGQWQGKGTEGEVESGHDE